MTTVVEEDVKVMDLLLSIDRRLQNLEVAIAKFSSGARPHEVVPVITPVQHSAVSQSHSLKQLAIKVSLGEDVLKGVFDLDGNVLTLIKTVDGNDGQKTKNVALLVLLGQKYVFGIEDVLSSEIKRNVSENRVQVNNFAAHLNGMAPSLIRRKGKAKSTTISYRLTTLGEAEAKALLTVLVNGEVRRVE
jgi:hypothetical protein